MCFENTSHKNRHDVLINRLPGNRVRMSGQGMFIVAPYKCQHTPVFLLGKSHEQRGLPVYSPWSFKGRTQLSTSHTFIILYIVLRESENFLQL